MNEKQVIKVLKRVKSLKFDVTVETEELAKIAGVSEKELFESLVYRHQFLEPSVAGWTSSGSQTVTAITDEAELFLYKHRPWYRKVGSFIYDFLKAIIGLFR